MRHDDGIEWLDAAPGDGADEDLAQPAGFPRLRRARLPLLVAGAVGLIAIVAVDVAGGPHGSPTAGPATVTAAPSSDPNPTPPATASLGPVPANGPRARIVIVMPSNGRVVTTTRIPSCPAGTPCEVALDTPDALRTAIRHALPGAHRLHTVTVTRSDGRGVLVQRSVDGRAGAARLRITIRPATAHDQLGWNAAESASQTLATVEDHVRGQLVTLRLVAPPGYRVDLPAVRRLAADQRLVTA